MNRIYVLQVS